MGWTDQQLPDGTVIWRAPSGRSYVTTPGSALLFPALCTPTGSLPPAEAGDAEPPGGQRGARMPRRRRTRAQNRARYLAAERKRNRDTRQARKAARRAAFEATYFPRIPPGTNPDDDPPPF